MTDTHPAGRRGGATMPDAIRKLPRCPVTGALIPFSSGTDATGAGQFGRNDPLATMMCAIGKLCGICGTKLEDDEVAFLIIDRRPIDLARLVFADPPNHEACAEWATQLCPRIANGPGPGWLIIVAASWTSGPPPTESKGLVGFVPGPVERIRIFAYGDRGKLAEGDGMTCPTEDWPEALRQRPVCSKRDLPIPFVNEIGPAGIGMFRVLDDRQAELCLRHRLCAMCSDPMGKEVALIGDAISLRPDGYFIEPPVHERCGLIAMGGLCPFLSHERVPRRPPEDDTTIVGDGRFELADIGRTVAKRPCVMAITESYSAAFTVNDTGGLTMVYQTRTIQRVRRYAWIGDRATEITDQLPRPVNVVRNQRRRKQPRSKR